MKKTIIISTILAATAFAVTSCNLDLRPAGTLEPANAFQTLSDAEHLRAGNYIAFRGRVSGTVTYTPDLASDLFHAVLEFGNRGGTFYDWIYTSVDGDAETVWNNCYYAIANVNYFIDNANSCNKADWSDEDLATLKNYIGEAFFLRAFYHFQLIEKFCPDYEGNEETFGIPYMKHYNPTSDQTKYPNRGTMSGTYANIMDDLDSAAAYVSAPGQKASIWITSDAVKALTARVALNMRDYQTAIENASALVNSGTYPLISDAAAFNDIWANDSGDEAILQLTGSYPGALPSSYSYNYVGYNANTGVYTPDYIPEQWLLDLFTENAGDIRYSAFFEDVTIFENYPVTIFYKFVGNPALKDPSSVGNSGVNLAKPFRISEQYLILAEAYARSGNSPQAFTVLNQIREKRIPGYVGNQAGDVLEEIFEERIKELIGEGFYWTDLKRFEKPMQRGEAQAGAPIRPINNEMHRDASDYRWVWPIPQEELDANPNIANQQNPGYSGN